MYIYQIVTYNEDRIYKSACQLFMFLRDAINNPINSKNAYLPVNIVFELATTRLIRTVVLNY